MSSPAVSAGGSKTSAPAIDESADIAPKPEELAAVREAEYIAPAILSPPALSAAQDTAYQPFADDVNDESASSYDAYRKGATEFVATTLKRTGTLVNAAKDTVVQQSNTIYKGASDGINTGLKRTGTLSYYEGAKEGFSAGLKRGGTIIANVQSGLSSGFNTSMNKSESIYSGARENVTAGLKRSGTLVGEAKEGMLKRAGTFGQQAVGTEAEPTMLRRTGTLVQEAGQGVVQRTSNLVGTASTYAKGFYDPSAPYIVSIRLVDGVELKRVHHSVSIIDGRAYIFGGEDADGTLVDSEMTVVILPSSGVHEADYKTIKARPAKPNGPTPASRKGHAAVVVGDKIYIVGGQLSEKAKPEPEGRVWVYDTFSLKWNVFDPIDEYAQVPVKRLGCAAVGTPEPASANAQLNANGRTVRFAENQASPKPKEQSPTSLDEVIGHGTIFIHGGIPVAPSAPAVVIEGEEVDDLAMDTDEPLNDVWAYNIASNTWSPLATPWSPAKVPRLALAGDRLYRLAPGNKSVEMLNVSEVLDTRKRNAGKGVTVPSLLRKWASFQLPAFAADDGKGPEAGAPDSSYVSTPATLTTIITPANYTLLLLILHAAIPRAFALDVSSTWAASASSTLKYANELVNNIEDDDAEEEDVLEATTATTTSSPVVNHIYAVKFRYVDSFGDELKARAGRSGLGGEEGYAASAGSQVEGSDLLIWGGKRGAGVTGRGWLLNVHF